MRQLAEEAQTEAFREGCRKAEKAYLDLAESAPTLVGGAEDNE